MKIKALLKILTLLTSSQVFSANIDSSLRRIVFSNQTPYTLIIEGIQKEYRYCMTSGETLKINGFHVHEFKNQNNYLCLGIGLIINKELSQLVHIPNISIPDLPKINIEFTYFNKKLMIRCEEHMMEYDNILNTEQSCLMMPLYIKKTLFNY